MSFNKIFDKNIPSFEDNRNDIINNYNECKGKIKKILNEVLPNYKLSYNKIDEKGAKYAIQKGRPCHFSFLLNKRGWVKFFYFCEKHKGEILQKKNLIM